MKTGTFDRFMEEQQEKGAWKAAKNAINKMLDFGYSESEIRPIFIEQVSPEFIDRTIEEWKGSAGSIPAAM